MAITGNTPQSEPTPNRWNQGHETARKWAKEHPLATAGIVAGLSTLLARRSARAARAAILRVAAKPQQTNTRAVMRLTPNVVENVLKENGFTEELAKLRNLNILHRNEAVQTHKAYEKYNRILNSALESEKEVLNHQKQQLAKLPDGVAKEAKKESIKVIEENIKNLESKIAESRIAAKETTKELDVNYKKEVGNLLEEIAIKQQNTINTRVERVEKLFQSVIHNTAFFLITDLLFEPKQQMTVPALKQMINEEGVESIMEYITEKIDEIKSKRNELNELNFKTLLCLAEFESLSNTDKDESKLEEFNQISNVFDFIKIFNEKGKIIKEYQTSYESVRNQFLQIIEKEHSALAKKYGISEKNFNDLIQASKQKRPNEQLLEKNNLTEEQFHNFLRDHSEAHEAIKKGFQAILDEKKELFTEDDQRREEAIFNFFEVNQYEANVHTATAENLGRFYQLALAFSTFIPEAKSVQLRSVRNILGEGVIFQAVKKAAQKTPATAAVALITAVLWQAHGFDPKEHSLENWLRKTYDPNANSSDIAVKIQEGGAQAVYDILNKTAKNIIKGLASAQKTLEPVWDEAYDLVVEGMAKSIKDAGKNKSVGAKLKDTPETRQKIRNHIKEIFQTKEILEDRLIEEIKQQLGEWHNLAVKKRHSFPLSLPPGVAPSPEFVDAMKFFGTQIPPRGAFHLDHNQLDPRFLNHNFLEAVSEIDPKALPPRRTLHLDYNQLPDFLKEISDIDSEAPSGKEKEPETSEPSSSTVIGVNLISQGIFSVIDRIYRSMP